MSEVHVAVAIIQNQSNEVLISLRPNHVHQGGLWEFPGGKVEKNETVFDALKRELSEELGITVINAQPYKMIRHEYQDKKVILDVWIVKEFGGIPRGVEGQSIKWMNADQLEVGMFPAANRSIVLSLVLPDTYMITGEAEGNDEFLRRLKSSLDNGVTLVQLRSIKNTDDEYLSLAKKAQKICDEYKATLLLNTSVENFNKLNAKGLHLNGRRLHATDARPVVDTQILSVSCHTVNDIKKAVKLNADIVLLSPVKETKSHPGVKGMGWSRFSELIVDVNIPVYALGGMSLPDIEIAQSSGAKGIAAISSFW